MNNALYNKPELLIPAGSPEKMKVAFLYGADAVYLAGLSFGLRAAADNFTKENLAENINYAHKLNKKVYITVNSFLHNKDLAKLPDFINFLNDIKPDAIIASDLGAVRIIKKHSNIPIHLSTQASCINTQTTKVWKHFGIERVILGREVTIEEGGQIAQQANIEVEMFIHGALCMAYSGHCVISNFTAGRDSNRGGCIQSCRFNYNLTFLDDKSKNINTNSHFMSSKDLAGIELIGDFFNHNIASLKVEGRMKSPYYVAITTLAYRKAIDCFAQKGKIPASYLKELYSLLLQLPRRDFSLGSLKSPAKKNSVFYNGEATQKYSSKRYLGMIVAESNESLALRVNAPIKKGDKIEIISPSGEIQTILLNNIYTLDGKHKDKAHPNNLIALPKKILSFNPKPYLVARANA